MNSFFDAFNSDRPFKHKSHQVWFRRAEYDEDDDIPYWIVYDECGTFVEDYNYFTVSMVMDTNWQIKENVK